MGAKMDREAILHDEQSSALAEPDLPSSDVSAAWASEAEQKLGYPPPAGVPTQQGPKGIRFDFNQGPRVLLPNRTEGK
jgi:hypothetical protein